MIYVKLMGGHSNQMFQYALARSLSVQNNMPFAMDDSWFSSMAKADTPRVYELGVYNIAENFARPGLGFAIKQKLGLAQRYNEKGFGFDSQIASLEGDIYLNGFFQTEKYFKNIRDVLLQDFTYKNKPMGKNAKLLKEIELNESAVSLHIRRGDYVTNKDANQFHGLKDIDYYRAALKLLKKKIKYPTLYVISNDPKWCKENLKLDAPMVFVDNNDDITGGAEDMRLMRSCKHNIMANSSFSWWGAWLNENPEKIVIAPKQWFQDPGIDISDLLPKEWIKL